MEVEMQNMKDGPWALMSRYEIPTKDGSGDIYLSRFRIIKTPLFSVYVHDLNLPDDDRDPHNHPWRFWSLVLRGGYTERVTPIASSKALWRSTHSRVHLRGGWHRMDMDSAHIIVSVLPKTKTLVFTGRRCDTWGFWTEDGFVGWRSYVLRYYGEGA